MLDKSEIIAPISEQPSDELDTTANAKLTPLGKIGLSTVCALVGFGWFKVGERALGYDRKSQGQSQFGTFENPNFTVVDTITPATVNLKRSENFELQQRSLSAERLRDCLVTENECNELESIVSQLEKLASEDRNTQDAIENINSRLQAETQKLFDTYPYLKDEAQELTWDSWLASSNRLRLRQNSIGSFSSSAAPGFFADARQVVTDTEFQDLVAEAVTIFEKVTGRPPPPSLEFRLVEDLPPDRAGDYSFRNALFPPYHGVIRVEQAYDRGMTLRILLHEIGHGASTPLIYSSEISEDRSSFWSKEGQHEACAELFLVAAIPYLSDPVLREEITSEIERYHRDYLNEYLEGSREEHREGGALLVAAIKLYGSPGLAFNHVAYDAVLDPRLEEITRAEQQKWDEENARLQILRSEVSDYKSKEVNSAYQLFNRLKRIELRVSALKSKV